MLNIVLNDILTQKYHHLETRNGASCLQGVLISWTFLFVSLSLSLPSSPLESASSHDHTMCLSIPSNSSRLWSSAMCLNPQRDSDFILLLLSPQGTPQPLYHWEDFSSFYSFLTKAVSSMSPVCNPSPLAWSQSKETYKYLKTKST